MSVRFSGALTSFRVFLVWQFRENKGQEGKKGEKREMSESVEVGKWKWIGHVHISGLGNSCIITR